MSRQEDDRMIVSEFGGLNTTSTPDSMPLGDASHLINVLPTIGGSLEKRPGSRVLYRDSYGRYGVSIASISTARGYKFLVSKEGTSIRVYLTTTSGLYAAIQKDNVFDNAALRVRAQLTVLNDIPTRVLFLTGVNKPVQLQFAELLTTVTGASSATSVVFTNAEIANGVTASSVLLFKDRELVTGTIGLSYSSGTLTVTGIPAYSGNAVFEFVVVTWQWWAEARQWYGDRFYNTVPRLHLSASTDVNVEVPTKLRTDLLLDTTSTAPRYPITAYPSSTSFGAPFTYKTTLDPTLATEYSFGDGSPYTPAAGAVTNPTPLFLTFGAIVAASQATTVHLFRRRELLFNGVKRSITGANLKTYINDVIVAQNLLATASGTYGSYYLYKTESDAPALNTSDDIKYLSFEASTTMGVPSLSIIKMVNVEKSHIGSAAIQTLWKLAGQNFDGGFVAIAGIGDVADYFRGCYPTTSALFKGRLLLTGFRHQPQSVLVSAVFDSRTELPYASFQITDDDVLATDALQVNLPAVADDRITALISWQDSSFVLTDQGAYRISSGDSTALSRDAAQISLMARVGCVNAFSVAATETGVYYLSTSGLFSLNSRDNLRDQYNAVTASLKINNVWGALKFNSENAWIAYDSDAKLMYVGLPEYNLPQDYTLKLYVYHVQLAEWSEFYTHGHFRIYHSCFHDSRLVFAATTQSNVSAQPTNFIVANFGDTTYNLDFVDVAATTDGNSGVYAVVPYVEVTHTLSANILEYATEGYKTGQLSGFRLSPLVTLNDVRAFINGVELAFGRSYDEAGAQFVKLSNGNIRILTTPTTGQILKLIPRMVL